MRRRPARRTEENAPTDRPRVQLHGCGTRRGKAGDLSESMSRLMPESVIAGDNSFSGFRRRRSLRSVGASLTPTSEVLLWTADEHSTKAVVCRDRRTRVFPTHFARELLCLPSGDGGSLFAPTSPSDQIRTGHQCFPRWVKSYTRKPLLSSRTSKGFVRALNPWLYSQRSWPASGLNCMRRTSTYWSLVVAI